MKPGHPWRMRGGRSQGRSARTHDEGGSRTSRSRDSYGATPGGGCWGPQGGYRVWCITPRSDGRGLLELGALNARPKLLDSILQTVGVPGGF